MHVRARPCDIAIAGIMYMYNTINGRIPLENKGILHLSNRGRPTRARVRRAQGRKLHCGQHLAGADGTHQQFFAVV
jgi:hypothetical protein